MKRSPRMKALGRIGAAAVMVGTVLSVGGTAGLWGAGAPASAAAAGSARIVDPASLGGDGALTSGGSNTSFGLKLPNDDPATTTVNEAAACTKDSANEGYRIQSFLVPQSVDLDTLKFNSSGPVPVDGEVRQPLFFVAGESPLIDNQTATAVPPGGPGPIIQPLDPFNFAVFPAGFLTAGVYSIGIACTLGNSSSATQLDKYWNTTITIAADAADPGPAKIRFEVTAAAPETVTTLAVSPATTAAQGTEVTLTATVTPAAAVGSVTFKDGTTALGAPVALAGGTAMVKKSDLTTGAHSFTAAFAPATAGAFGPSTSAAATFTVTAGTGTTTSTTMTGSSTTSTTSTTSSASSTSTTTADGGSGGGSGGSGGGSGSGAPKGALPKSGSTLLPLLGWSFLLILAGRAAVLLGRRPAHRRDER